MEKSHVVFASRGNNNFRRSFLSRFLSRKFFKRVESDNLETANNSAAGKYDKIIKKRRRQFVGAAFLLFTFPNPFSWNRIPPCLFRL